MKFCVESERISQSDIAWIVKCLFMLPISLFQLSMLILCFFALAIISIIPKWSLVIKDMYYVFSIYGRTNPISPDVIK